MPGEQRPATPAIPAEDIEHIESLRRAIELQRRSAWKRPDATAERRELLLLHHRFGRLCRRIRRDLGRGALARIEEATGLAMAHISHHIAFADRYTAAELRRWPAPVPAFSTIRAGMYRR